MEIGGTLSPGLAIPQALEPRAPSPAPPVARSAAVEQPVIIRESRNDNRNGATLTRQETGSSTDPGRNVEDKQKARVVEQTQSRLTVTPGGSIQFEIEDRTRLMKVLDSKEVLIYQVPTKGELTLVRAEEKAAAQQVQTSA